MIRLESVNIDREFSKQELIEIDDALNRWEWDERLGPAPDGWDTMPFYLTPGEESRKRFLLRRRPMTRHVAMQAIRQEIERYVSAYDTLKYHHIHSLGRTEQEFTEWYLGEIGNRVLEPWRD